MNLNIETQLLPDAADFVSHWQAIGNLRSDLGAGADVLLDPLHFLAATDDTRRSCSVACWRNGRLIGVVYATEHFLRGLGSGYAVGGDFTGRGLLLCRPDDEALVLREAVRTMSGSGIHSLHLRFLPRDPARFSLRGLKMKFLDAVIPGDRMALEPSFEGFLNKLGKHTRRNIRAFTRKTEEAGISFSPSLSEKEYRDALDRLNPGSDFPVETLHVERDERVMALHGGGERFGLRSRDGVLVAILCGFQRGDRFHLLTQINDSAYRRMSLSIVLRGYLTNHLIERGCRELQFMGGSSLSFGRYCEPQNYRSIFIDKRRGFAVAAKMFCGKMAGVMSRLRLPIPEFLAILSSGYLGERELSRRTALRPAAMLVEQQQAS